MSVYGWVLEWGWGTGLGPHLAGVVLMADGGYCTVLYGCRRTAKKLVATGLFGPTGSDFLINSHRGKVTLGGKKGGKSYDYGYGR